MRDLAILGTYIVMMISAVGVPCTAALAYIWTDLVRPQYVAYGFMTQLPLSMICAVIALLSWFRCRERPSRITFGVFVLILWTVWMTITTLNAEVPDSAWYKWDWAFKGAAFSIFLPYFFNNRDEIEAALLTILAALAANLIPVGLKTFVAGGGYGMELTLTNSPTGITEGSTLAMVGVSVVPLFLWAGEHARFLGEGKLRKLLAFGLSAVSLIASLGTFARTGLVSAAVLAVIWFFRTRRKFVYVLVLVGILSGVQGFMGSAWSERMATLKSAGDETSAMGRVAVWLWTIDYAQHHPLGGGFDVYRINNVSVEMADGSMLQETRKAFHSIYFEVLGEQGVPGIAMFLTMLLWSFASLRRVVRIARGRSDLLWMSEAAKALMVSTTIFMTGGAFVGVAYQPYFWVLFAIGVALRHHADRLAGVPEIKT